MRYSDGTVRQYYKKNRMWVVDVCDSNCEVACAACEKKLEHAAKGHPHDPQCEHCMRGRMRARARPRRTLVTNNQTGVTVYLDLMGPFEPDVTGSVYEMTVLEGQHGWIEIEGIKDKSSESTAERFLDTLRDVLSRSNQRSEDVSRVHTDQGNEFKGRFDRIVRQMTAQHTDTGGYNSSTNPAENAQGRVQQSGRAMLVASTGGHKYYQELRGPVLKRAAYCINRCDRGSVASAYKKAWGESFVWTSDEHAFASRCLYRTHSHERDKMEALSEVGLWVGRNLDSNQHLVIPLDAYDSIADEYVLGKLLSVSTVRVFDDQFPLRCIPTGDSDLVKFNDFVDRFDPLYQHAPIEGDGDLEGEYQVKSII